MAEIGNFGKELVFETSDQKILTFSGFNQKVSGRWSDHIIIGSKTHKEFNGPGNRKISFEMTLDATLGVKPREVMEKMEKMIESGYVDYLVIGGKMIGENRFVITDMSEKWGAIYSRGELARINLNVSMEEYI